MGCGIVSTDLYSYHQPVLSAILLWFAAGAWLLLAVVLGLRLAYQRERFMLDASSPAALTGVAGIAVLGTRLALQGNHAVAAPPSPARSRRTRGRRPRARVRGTAVPVSTPPRQPHDRRPAAQSG
jgi:hypothetical protein